MPPARNVTETVYGLNAALAVFAHRPDDVVRIAHTRAVRSEIGEMLRFAASKRLPYREVDDAELARIADATHHEGICLTTRPRRTLSAIALGEMLIRVHGASVLALDDVGNPHNLGAILRSAAYFGIDAVLFAQGPGQAQLTPGAVRIAEGGAEIVALACVPELGPALATLRAKKVNVIGTDARKGTPLWSTPLPRPCVVVLGNERKGMSPAVRAQCTAAIAIPGSGEMDSLNVSVAAGVLLAEMARTR